MECERIWWEIRTNRCGACGQTEHLIENCPNPKKTHWILQPVTRSAGGPAEQSKATRAKPSRKAERPATPPVQPMRPPA